MEDVREELDDRGTLGVVGGEGQPELEDRVRVVSCDNGNQYTRAIPTASNDGPWCTKKTASQTMRLSGEGVTYMPNGQWPVWRREAYSRETAVRVRAGVASSVMLPWRVPWRWALAFAGEERSTMGAGTKLESILDAIRDRCAAELSPVTAP